MSGLRCLALALCTSTACSYEWHAIRSPEAMPQAVPRPRIDRLASEINLQSTGGIRFEPTEAEQVRTELGRALETILRPRHPEDMEIARYKLDATLERRGNWSYAYIVLPFAPFLGAPTHRVDADVTLKLQIGSAHYEGKGSSRVFGGFFYNYRTREKALARAFREALQQAVTRSGVQSS